MKRPSPLTQMTLALVGLCGMLVLLADLFLGVLPDRDQTLLKTRSVVSETLAVQVAALMQSGDAGVLQRTLDAVRERTPALASLAIRRTDGLVLMQSGAHAQHWQPSADGRSHPEQFTVPLHSGSAPWGSVELAFFADPRHALWRWLTQPLTLTLMFVWLAGVLVFGLYMRRALQHLDPASVIPERVQGAFDAMSEGVVVLDARGRMLLATSQCMVCMV
jgi:hypothetical protein